MNCGAGNLVEIAGPQVCRCMLHSTCIPTFSSTNAYSCSIVALWSGDHRAQQRYLSSSTRVAYHGMAPPWFLLEAYQTCTTLIAISTRCRGGSKMLGSNAVSTCRSCVDASPWVPGGLTFELNDIVAFSDSFRRATTGSTHTTSYIACIITNVYVDPSDSRTQRGHIRLPPHGSTTSKTTKSP